jgi:hypothetical protein
MIAKRAITEADSRAAFRRALLLLIGGRRAR